MHPQSQAKLAESSATVESLHQQVHNLQQRRAEFESHETEVWRLLHPNGSKQHLATDQIARRDESIRAIQQLHSLVSSTQQRCTLLATEGEKLEKLLHQAQQQLDETSRQMTQHALEAARMSARNEVLEGQLKQVPDSIQVAIAERRMLEVSHLLLLLRITLKRLSAVEQAPPPHCSWMCS